MNRASRDLRTRTSPPPLRVRSMTTASDSADRLISCWIAASRRSQVVLALSGERVRSQT